MEMLIKTALRVNHLGRTFLIKQRIYRKICSIDGEIAVTTEPVPFAEREKLSYMPLHRFKSWGGMFDCGWIHLVCDLPADVDRQNTVVVINTRSEGARFGEDGSPAQGLSPILSPLDAFGIRMGKKVLDIPQECFDNGKIDMWIETGNNGFMGKSTGKSRLLTCFVASVDTELRSFYYDYLTVFFMLAGAPKDERRKLAHALNNAYLRFAVNLPEAQKYLSEVLTDKGASDFTAYMIGHSHLDLAWLWPVRETHRKAGRTFANALTNIEKYPFYLFGASEAQQFDWVKHDYPAQYERIKQAVADGRIEPLGCMWVEPDINMSGGESIIRQIAYGKAFFKQEFGFDARVCWLPDVFGFSGDLPGILQGCGVDYFLTIKLSWNKFNKFPLTTFRWKGIDGSEVITHMPPEGTYESDGAPFSVRESFMKNRDDPRVCDSVLIPFGTGDGGGGPGEIHLEIIDRERELKSLPRVEPKTSIEFFDRVATKRAELPEYGGELYLEAHQGTYTSQVQMKYYNRMAEKYLHRLEYLGVFAGEDAVAMERLWKQLLLQQFHDILPGTSVKRVHDESVQDYLRLNEDMREYESTLLRRLGTTGRSAVNYSPYPVDEWREYEGEWHHVSLPPYTARSISPSLPDTVSLKSDNGQMSNGILSLVIDKHGVITSLKTADGKEWAKGGLNRLTFYRDKRMFWNASDMDPFYYKKKLGAMRCVSQTFCTVGAEAVAKLTFKRGHTTVMQEIVLGLGREYVEFRTDIDFHERLKMLRADFLPTEFGEQSIADIQFGSIARNTDYADKAQFEISAHKWLDVSNKAYGCAFLSDSRYGFRAKGGLMSMCLVRGTVFPGKHGGCGKHTTRYAWYPHTGDTYSSRVREYGSTFSYPVEILPYDISLTPPITVDNPNVVISNMHASGAGIAVRLYESAGCECETAFNVCEDIVSVEVCDLLENKQSDTDSNTLHFRPFEIKTLRLVRNSIQ